MQKGGIYFFLVIFALTLLALLKLYSPFLMNLLIAFLLFIATQNVYYVILKYIKSPLASTFLMTLLLIILCFLPIFYILLKVLLCRKEMQILPPCQYPLLKAQVHELFEPYPYLQNLCGLSLFQQGFLPLL